METEFIKIIRMDSSKQFQFEESIRAIVLIVEDFLPRKEFCEWLETVETPILLALKNSTTENLVAAAHICVAAIDSQIGQYSAKQALKLGLINRVFPKEDVETEALKLAERISTLAPLAIRACLKAVNGLTMPLEDGLRLESKLFAQIFSTGDMREGTTAFLEKRKAVFQGK